MFWWEGNDFVEYVAKGEFFGFCAKVTAGRLGDHPTQDAISANEPRAPS